MLAAGDLAYLALPQKPPLGENEGGGSDSLVASEDEVYRENVQSMYVVFYIYIYIAIY